MRYATALFVIVFALVQSAYASEQPAWLGQAISTASARVAQRESDVAAAQDALSKAQTAQAAARAENNAQVESAAAGLIQTDKTLIARAKARLAQAEAFLANLKRIINGEDIAGAPIGVTGQATLYHDGKPVESSNGVMAPLRDGDEIRTTTGTADLVFRDGEHVVLGPKTIYTITKMTRLQSLYKLLGGSIHMQRLPEGTGAPLSSNIQIQTLWGVAAVRGTSFDLRAGAGQTHLALYEGVVDLSGISASNAHGPCALQRAGQTISLHCGSSPASAGFAFKAGSLNLRTIGTNCVARITLRDAGPPDVVVSTGTLRVDAGKHAFPSKGWWTAHD
jgi:ferric-dicitrate binding protein FerR (iron transport regulator)